MSHYIALTAVGVENSKVFHQLIHCLTKCGANILRIRMLTLGCELGATLLLEGSWSAVAKIETQVELLQQELGLHIHVKRTEPKELGQIPKGMPYMVHVLTADRAGILNELIEFFVAQGVSIDEASAQTYSSQTGAQMVSMNLHINIDVDIHLATLREQFMSYCDLLNLDAGIEPLREFI